MGGYDRYGEDCVLPLHYTKLLLSDFQDGDIILAYDTQTN